MRSTGEVLGLAATYTEALDAARRAEAAHLAPGAEPAVPVLEPSGQR
jgi:hypothetical protein